MGLLHLKLRDIQSVAVRQLVIEFETIWDLANGNFEERMLLHVLQEGLGLTGDSRKPVLITKEDLRVLSPAVPSVLGTRLAKIEDAVLFEVCKEIAAIHPPVSIEMCMDMALYSFLNKRLVTKLPKAQPVRKWGTIGNDRSGFFDR